MTVLHSKLMLSGRQDIFPIVLVFICTGEVVIRNKSEGLNSITVFTVLAQNVPTK